MGWCYFSSLHHFVYLKEGPHNNDLQNIWPKVFASCNLVGFPVSILYWCWLNVSIFHHDHPPQSEYIKQKNQHSKPNQISKMELSAKIVNSFQLLTILAKNIHLRCLIQFWIHLRSSSEFLVMLLCNILKSVIKALTHFMPLVSFHTPSKNQNTKIHNQRFSGVFRGYRKRPVTRNSLILVLESFHVKIFNEKRRMTGWMN